MLWFDAAPQLHASPKHGSQSLVFKIFDELIAILRTCRGCSSACIVMHAGSIMQEAQSNDCTCAFGTNCSSNRQIHVVRYRQRRPKYPHARTRTPPANHMGSCMLQQTCKKPSLSACPGKGKAQNIGTCTCATLRKALVSV